jgi:hypothetical protein
MIPSVTLSTRIHVRCWAAGLVATVLQVRPGQRRREQQNGTLWGGVLYSVRMKLVQSEIQTSRIIKKVQPLPFYQMRYNGRKKKTKSWHWTNIWPWVPARLDARSDRAGWLPAVSYCSALLENSRDTVSEDWGRRIQQLKCYQVND